MGIAFRHREHMQQLIGCIDHPANDERSQSWDERQSGDQGGFVKFIETRGVEFEVRQWRARASKKLYELKWILRRKVGAAFHVHIQCQNLQRGNCFAPSNIINY